MQISNNVGVALTDCDRCDDVGGDCFIEGDDTDIITPVPLLVLVRYHCVYCSPVQ